jgi:hypothetical protein
MKNFFIRCKLCGHAVLFTSDRLHSHMMSNHKMTGSEYKKQYLVDGAEIKKGRKKGKGRKRAAEISDSEIVEDDLTETSSFFTDNFDKKDVTNNSVSEESYSCKPEGGDMRVLSDSARDMCRLKCNICKAPFKALRAHVQTHHHLSWREFRRRFPEELYAVKNYHR